MATINNFRDSNTMADESRFGGKADAAEAVEQPDHPLDSQAMEKRFGTLKMWLDQELQRQGANRYQMAMDEDYYDSMQWEENDAQTLMERGQAPLVFNEIKPTIDWVIGTERRTRIDYKVLPRRKEGSDDASTKTDILKYLSDTNKSPFHRSRAFNDAVKAGIGWIETGVRGDDTDELLYTRYEDWRKVVYDSNSVELDLSDARYQFRWKWLDEDIATAYFPDRAEILKEPGTMDKVPLSEQDDLWYMGSRVTQPGSDYASVGKYTPYTSAPFSLNHRPRIKIIEAWYRVPKLKRKFNGGEFQNVEFDSENQEHIDALKGQYSLYDKLEMEIRCAIFCAGGLLFEGPSPYKHGRFPLVPIWCYRRKRDNAPYGMIRNLRDPQDDLNKRASKALWILSSNRIIADEGAVDDWDELREEAARPDSLIIKKAGKELQIDRDVALAQEHLTLMERDVQHIRNVGGVTNENLGRETNASSGKAITARQDQGGVITTEPFDNLRLSTQLVGEMELSNIEQFMTAEKAVRVLGERGAAKFTSINAIQPDGSVLNDVTKEQADFVVSEQDYRSTLRQAMFESLFDVIGKLAGINPQIALNLLDIAFDSADLPNKDELVARIRKINGQRNPDEDPTPEELQAEQAQGMLVQKQQELAMQTAEANLAELIAKKDSMDAASIMKRVEAMYAALQAAQVISSVPAAATIADQIMKGSGFADAGQAQQAQMIQQAAGQMQPDPSQPQPDQGAQPGQPQNQAPDLQSQMQHAQPAALQGITHGMQTPQNDGAQ
jgi:hypothetical protein